MLNVTPDVMEPDILHSEPAAPQHRLLSLSEFVVIDDSDRRSSSLESKIFLPENYYLDHFLNFMENIRDTYLDYLSPSEKTLALGFFELSREEQQIFVRLSNRTGTVFLRSKLKYAEIASIDSAIAGLVEKGFLAFADGERLHECLRSLNKPHLLTLLRDHSKSKPWNEIKAWSKPQLLAEALSVIDFDNFAASSIHPEIVIRRFADELRYLCFLAFGDLKSDLKLYTLRDLGLKTSNNRSKQFARRFENAAEARSEFYFRRLREEVPVIEPAALAELVARPEMWSDPVGIGANRIREKLIFECSQLLTQAGDFETALHVLARGHSPQVVEKRIKLLQSLKRSEQLEAVLQSIIQEPGSAEALQIAEEFIRRRSGTNRKSPLTFALQQAETVRLDGKHRGRPEQGVVEYLAARGQRAYHTENYLWASLFGVIFWHELFESGNAALFTEFDTTPRDLLLGTFSTRNEAAIEQKLTQLAEPSYCVQLLRETILAHGGTPNGIFHWHRDLCSELVQFVEACYSANIDFRPVLLRLAKDFERSKRGFPDLLVYSGEKPGFIEIKALGDKLQPAQLRQLQFLAGCGFETQILRVEWNYDPNQVYVVVDVETTGFMPDRNRITELAAVKIKNGAVMDTFSTLINPECRIPRNITQLTGISNEMTDEAPIFASVAESFLTFLGDALFVGHNARFDHSFIRAEFQRMGLRFRGPMLCTSVGMRRAYPGLESYGLENLCREFEIELVNHHRALSDATATAELLRLILQRIEA